MSDARRRRKGAKFFGQTPRPLLGYHLTMAEPDISIREATPADAERLALTGAATFLEAYAGFLPGDAILAFCRDHHTGAAYQSLLADPENRAWLAETASGAAPVGYAVLVRQPQVPAGLTTPADMELKRIYLFSRFHGSGLAQRLLDHAALYARNAGASRLLVGLHRDNHRAMAFYRRQGFTEIGQRRFTVGNCCFEDPVLALTL